MRPSASAAHSSRPTRSRCSASTRHSAAASCPRTRRPGAPSVVLLGYGPWADRYGADPSIVGCTIRVNGESAVVIGITPAGFRFPVESDVWQPLAQMPGLDRQSRSARTLGVVGRLGEERDPPRGAGGTRRHRRAARRRASQHQRGRARQTPAAQRALLRRSWQPQPVVLMGSALFVLLIGCANAASLLLARSARRAREIALRAALGASRGRLLRQLLVESVLLATVASLVGLGLSRFGVHLFRTETTNFGMPVLDDVSDRPARLRVSGRRVPRQRRSFWPGASVASVEDQGARRAQGNVGPRSPAAGGRTAGQGASSPANSR